MKTTRRILGDLGESLAYKYLKRRGFAVIGRNFQRKCGEIDIIASMHGALHFIEVKSVSCEIGKGPGDVSCETGRFGGWGDRYRPENNVSPRKLARIAKTIQCYLEEKNLPISCDWRFHVITVLIDSRQRIGRVSFIKDIII